MLEKKTRLLPRRLATAFAVLELCLLPTARAADRVPAPEPATGVKLYGDIRTVAIDGEPGWSDGGFGKLRFGGTGPAGSGDLRIAPEFAEAGIVWQPRLSWSLGGTVVALAQGGDRFEAGLSEAYLDYTPLGGGPLRWSARAGLMWPPVSLEHSGPEWAVADTITPSAIGGWIGEEVKVIGVEITGRAQLGAHLLSATVAGFDHNDTAGALLTFRGWALHDRKALAFRRQPLPPLADFIRHVQPRYSHPLLDLDGGVLKRPGAYAKLDWSPPLPLRVEAVHYDNNADPAAVDADLEWGWRTRFDTLGLVAEPRRGWLLRAQAIAGRTRMGQRSDGARWIDMTFRAAYAMLTRSFARGSLSARLDLFGTRNRGSEVGRDHDEDGWAMTAAARRGLGDHAAVLLEYLHVESDRPARTLAMLDPRQTQNQLQIAVRLSWP